MRLKDKVAVITGGGTGIGRATALLFAREGARVVVADYNEETGQQTVDDIKARNGEAIFVRADVSRETDVQNMIAAAVSAYKKVDILFSNAGIGEVCPAADLTVEAWDRTININLRGVFLCAKHAIPVMQRNGGGTIINNASILGHVGTPGAAAYNSAKGGVVLLTKNLALEYARDNIRVNAVCPGYIKTPMVMNGLSEEMRDKLTALHPLGRLGEPEEVAYCVLFLASDESSFVTGSSLMVDGGYTAQ
jgi:NAD(P)-dependent dehydrogenase (short-subunit alcohol dehydrogenase family)